MSILTTIDGVPLFSTSTEALAWGAQRGLSGYHTHSYQGQTGYMGGLTHGASNNTSNNNSSNPRSSSGGNGSGGASY
tara:strand:- start:189 stop:419 length:231 start_codon:yes stop_codon:yes gene_type:complete